MTVLENQTLLLNDVLVMLKMSMMAVTNDLIVRILIHMMTVPVAIIVQIICNNHHTPNLYFYKSLYNISTTGKSEEAS